MINQDIELEFLSRGDAASYFMNIASSIIKSGNRRWNTITAHHLSSTGLAKFREGEPITPEEANIKTITVSWSRND
jgi:hypothetical protein